MRREGKGDTIGKSTGFQPTERTGLPNFPVGESGALGPICTLPSNISHPLFLSSALGWPLPDGGTCGLHSRTSEEC